MSITTSTSPKSTRAMRWALGPPRWFGCFKLQENSSQQYAQGGLLLWFEGPAQELGVARDELGERRPHQTTAGGGELDDDGAAVVPIAAALQQPDALELVHSPAQAGAGEHQAARHAGGRSAVGWTGAIERGKHLEAA